MTHRELELLDKLEETLRGLEQELLGANVQLAWCRECMKAIRALSSPELKLGEQ